MGLPKLKKVEEAADDRLRRRVMEAAEAFRTEVEAAVEERDAHARELVEDYKTRKESKEVREQVLQQAQRKVKSLEDGRAANLKAINNAQLDADQNGVKAARDAEKKRKEDLAAAERERDEAKHQLDQVSFDLHERSWAVHRAITALEHASRDAARKAGAVVTEAANIRGHVAGAPEIRREQERNFKAAKRDGDNRDPEQGARVSNLRDKLLGR